MNLLAGVAEEQPLVCIVDDAQWLDRVSVQTLAFVARRLLAERVGLVFALREFDHGHELEGLPELVIAGLAADDARRLLDATRSIGRSPTRPTRGWTRIAGRGTALARPTGPTRP